MYLDSRLLSRSCPTPKAAGARWSGKMSSPCLTVSATVVTAKSSSHQHVMKSLAFSRQSVVGQWLRASARVIGCGGNSVQERVIQKVSHSVGNRRIVIAGTHSERISHLQKQAEFLGKSHLQFQERNENCLPSGEIANVVSLLYNLVFNKIVVIGSKSPLYFSLDYSNITL